VNLWRLELARTIRTHRWALVVGVYAFFGVTGPLLARYLAAIVRRFGSGEVTMTVADPRPADGIVQFVGNASQLGLLAVTVVAAGALALDAHVEFAAFLRTKVEHAGRLLAPRLAVSAATAVLALWVGTAVAWAMTAALLGGLPVGAMLLGTLLGSLYLAFAVAVVAAVATVVRSVVATVFATLGVLLALPIVGVVPALSPWLPSELLAAVSGLVDGAPASDYARAAVVAVVAIAALVVVAARRVEAREP
jgi:ABC-2 type transport system permease protein